MKFHHYFVKFRVIFYKIIFFYKIWVMVETQFNVNEVELFCVFGGFILKVLFWSLIFHVIKF